MLPVFTRDVYIEQRKVASTAVVMDDAVRWRANQ